MNGFLRRLLDLTYFAYELVELKLIELVFNLRNPGFNKELEIKNHFAINSTPPNASPSSVDTKYDLKKKYFAFMNIILAKNLPKLKSFIEGMGKRDFESLCLCKNDSDQAKSTVLHYIAMKSDYAVMLEVVLRYVNKTDVGDSVGCTPLVYAVRFSNTNAVRLLVDRGVKINSQDLCGWSALHEAVILENLGEIKRTIIF
jgi:hypothetical protein